MRECERGMSVLVWARGGSARRGEGIRHRLRALCVCLRQHDTHTRSFALLLRHMPFPRVPAKALVSTRGPDWKAVNTQAAVRLYSASRHAQNRGQGSNPNVRRPAPIDLAHARARAQCWVGGCLPCWGNPTDAVSCNAAGTGTSGASRSGTSWHGRAGRSETSSGERPRKMRRQSAAHAQHFTCSHSWMQSLRCPPPAVASPLSPTWCECGLARARQCRQLQACSVHKGRLGTHD